MRISKAAAQGLEVLAAYFHQDADLMSPSVAKLASLASGQMEPEARDALCKLVNSAVDEGTVRDLKHPFHRAGAEMYPLPKQDQLFWSEVAQGLTDPKLKLS